MSEGRTSRTNTKKKTYGMRRKTTSSGGKTSHKKTKKKVRWGRVILLLLAVILLAGLLILAAMWVKQKVSEISGHQADSGVSASIANELYIPDRPELDVELLDVNSYSRPGIALSEVNGIVVHYTANPGTSAMQNRDYFAGLATEHTTKASSHFIIGLEGEIVQCIPCDEMAYASNDRNSDTLAIECCIPDEEGKFNDDTYSSLIHLVSWLMGRYGLTTDDVIRHYDVTGKECPKYYVDHPEAWEQFKTDVNVYIAENGVSK